MQTGKELKDRFLPSVRGFTLIEILIVVGIIGMLSLAFYPSVMNSLETRALESEAKDVLATFQRAKFQAVKTKLNHRVRFSLNESGLWEFMIEREETANTWTPMPGSVKKVMNAKFDMTVNLPDPDLALVFTSLGFAGNYDPLKNAVIMQSDKLSRFNKPDQREVHVLAGGSCRYLKSSSE